MAKTDSRKQPRGARSPIPQWWIRQAWALIRERFGTDLTLHTLGVKLATAAGRSTPWSHSTLGRFFAERPTSDIADALVALLPELPTYAYYPVDELEAVYFEDARRRAAAARKREAVAPLLAAVDQRVGIASSLRVDVASADAKEPPGGAARTGGSVRAVRAVRVRGMGPGRARSGHRRP